MYLDEHNCRGDEPKKDAAEEVLFSMPGEDEVEKIAALFKVFSDNTRVRILWALDKKELCVCDIAAVLDMTESAVSHQLKYLRLSNLVKSRREGKAVFYSLSDSHVRQIFEKAVEHINE